MDNTIYIVETPDGDVWRYEDMEDARRAVYIFGGTITKEDKNNE